MVVQKIYLKMHPVSCTNTYYDVTDLLIYGMVKNIKTSISWEGNITFLWKKKIINQCLRWHILISCHLVAEIAFKDYVPHSCSINSHDNNFKEIKELINTNNASLSSFIKKRKYEFCKYTTRD